MNHKLILLTILIQFLFCCNNSENKNENISEENAPSFSSNINKSEKRFPLLVSNDIGASWQVATENLPEDIQVSFLKRKGSGMVLASDNMGVFLSAKNKSEWNSIGDELPIKKINALHVYNQ